MFSDRWNRTGPSAGHGQSQSVLHAAGRASDSGGDAPRSRNSNGLGQFFGNIRGESGLNILDLSAASQANIAFITNLGHRLYSEDLLTTLQLAFGSGAEFYENQLDPDRQNAFFEQNLNFPPGHFDGALLWDSLEFLQAPMLKAAIERLHSIVKPGSYLFALFHTEERGENIATFHYRIADEHTLLLTPRGQRNAAQLFSNRAIEKLFQGFDNVKFFLTRDSLREVIVKR